MLGYPGAGKTTTAKYIAELTGATHLWADQVRNERYKHPTHSHNENIELYEYLNSQAEELLREGKSLVFDTGFNFYQDREHLRNIASKYGAETTLVWVKTNKGLAKERATHPQHAVDNTYLEPMKPERFDRISSDFEHPKGDENCIEIDGTNVTEELVKKALEL